MNCNDANAGRADFLAGRKDEERYNDAANGADYRRGWQLARLGQTVVQQEEKPRPVASAAISDVPPWYPETIGVMETAQSQPAAVLTPVVEIVEKPAKLANCAISQTDPKCLTQQDVRLAVGEEKPAKSKPAPAGQLDLFG